MSVCTLDASEWLQLPFGSSGACLVPQLGESGGFCRFQGMLMISITFAVVNASVTTLCMSVRVLDASAWLLQLSGLSGVHFAVLVGESGGFSHFHGMLTFSGTFSCVIASVSTLGTSQCPLDTSNWLPTVFIAFTTRFVSLMLRYVPAPSP